MLGQIVEIEGAGRRISLDRGFLCVAGPDGPIGKAPLDDIEARYKRLLLRQQLLAALLALVPGLNPNAVMELL